MTSTETTTMMTSNIDRDGQTRPFVGHGQAQLASAGGVSMLRGVFEPGWRWTQDLGPIAGTSSCQARHLGYVVSGRMHIVTADGSEGDIGPGDLFDLAPGHDAWVVGDEACVMVDVSPDATRYAQPASAATASPDPAMDVVRRGYAAFNAGDVDTLRTLLASDVVQHVPGTSSLAGTYKGVDNVLGYYGKLGEMTDGTFRVFLIETHGDGAGHVTALHQLTAVRNGTTRVTHGSILFTVTGGRVTDLLELRADLAGDDAFFA
ncbi:MAG TPA: nuclear transport factor 2 family protein [Segeticoccus sp.]|uniref:nuclear transport factor 2 family protein n=1 Tax=Segeticoccus sp. TaxID=2706531 RepID=UPI002D807990|nr:nuclear transport factor 2 family protein [Segeticoccus sp.]HET8602006.1 nuclear transport factor 2 family protein [Segeticoccus sp.]